MPPPKCMVITLTYNNQQHLAKWAESLNAQTCFPQQIVLVDTGSKDKSYLSSYRTMKHIQIIEAPKESGFCKGNNIAYAHIQADIEYVLFLNPDAFLSKTFIEQALASMQLPQNKLCGALTGPLLGYDLHKESGSGLYDSTGIFQTFYGKWYDRDQGKPYESCQYSHQEMLPAICGACFFARRIALKSVQLAGQEIFDSSFYMYKEDIDLSLRLKEKGWQLLFVPQLIAHHCRGWQKDRQKMAKTLRLHSARNELTLQKRMKKLLPRFYSTCKYLAVKYLNF